MRAAGTLGPSAKSTPATWLSLRETGMPGYPGEPIVFSFPPSQNTTESLASTFWMFVMLWVLLLRAMALPVAVSAWQEAQAPEFVIMCMPAPKQAFGLVMDTEGGSDHCIGSDQLPGKPSNDYRMLCT